jgi:hypothetical protein
VEAAYRRTDFFDRRRRLMLSWAQFVMSGVSIAEDASDPQKARSAGRYESKSAIRPGRTTIAPRAPRIPRRATARG